MRVRVGTASSRPTPVTSGVPQGSCLGPALFLIYVNHVATNLSCRYKIFADDIKLYLAHVPGISGGEINLQHNVNLLVATASSWGLQMNPSKCVCMRFSPRSCSLPFEGVSPYDLNGTYINFVLSYSDLGVVVDRDFKFHAHIRRRVGMVTGLTSNILSCTLCRDAEFLTNIYKSLIRPQIEYCSSLWNLGYLGDVRLLERVQRRWTRSIAGYDELSYGDRLRRLDLFSVQGRLLRNDLVLTWKIFSGLCSISPMELFVLNRSTRTRGHPLKIFLPRCRLEARKRFFSVRVVHHWNALSEDTVCAESLEKFKQLLHRDLGPKLYEFLD